MSPVLWPINVHHIPKLKFGFDVERSLKISIFDINFSSEVRNLLNIGLE